MSGKTFFLSTSRSTALVVLVLFVTIGTMASYFVASDYAVLSERAESKSKGFATLSAQVMREKFELLTSIGTALATRVQFRKLIEAGDWDAAVKIMDAVPKDFPYIDSVVLFDQQGTLKSITPLTSEVVPAIGKNFSYRDYYKGVSKRWQPYVSEAFNRAVQPSYGLVSAAIPIRSELDGGVLGFMLLTVRLESIVAWTGEIGVGTEKTIYLFDQNGHLVAHPSLLPESDLVDLSADPFVQRILTGKSGSEITVDPVEKERSLVSFQRVPDFGWAVVVTEPVGTTFWVRDAQVRKDVVLWSVLIVALVSIAVLLLRSRDALALQLARERKLVEEKVRAMEMVEASNKDLESFTYSVSHDLRAPLRSIDGFSKILEDDYAEKLNNNGAHVIATIRESVARMGNLIDDLLAFSRLGRQQVQKTDVDMAELAESVFTAVAEANPGRDIRFSRQDLPHAHADPALMRQVWSNLLSNAAKFTRGTKVADISVGSSTEGGFVTYFVKDNGVGFDMKYGGKLFQVFQRLHSAQEFEGSGVGLSIVARIVEKHGGKAWATGTVGKGATFFFSLPT